MRVTELITKDEILSRPAVVWVRAAVHEIKDKSLDFKNKFSLRVLIPYFHSFVTRIPHSELLSSLFRIVVAEAAAAAVKTFVLVYLVIKRGA